ncbi:dephospho-CoA kinase isoform X2 [Rhodnius prolixus]|uniref:dephospho-CoA kinase isoform X2 n=1 Tax=Rhodnius prolixus TaxID=13249 RepID=UPI003D18F1B4
MALTGGISTGKSTVARLLQNEHGIPVVDADFYARKVVEPGKKAWYKIRSSFGDEVFKSDDQIDREKLGHIVFRDTSKRRCLNQITHPEIMKEMLWMVCKYALKGYPFVVMDLPLLFEIKGDLLRFVHKIIVVTCEPDIQLKRLIDRDLKGVELAKMKISAQMPLEEKARLANFVIDNNGSFEETREQVNQVVAVLKSDKFHLKIRIFLSLVSVCLMLLMIFLIYLGCAR